MSVWAVTVADFFSGTETIHIVINYLRSSLDTAGISKSRQLRGDFLGD